MGFTTTGAATRPTDEVLQRFDGFLFADMAAGDLADFAAVPDHVLARLPGPDFGRSREQAVRGCRRAVKGTQDDEEMTCP